MKIQLATALTLSICGFAYAQKPNNILVIVADDLGCEVLDLYNTPTAKKAKTPNLDRMAEQGITFDNVWGAPLSAPVRAAMLTGRHGHHTGILALDITLPLKEETLFEAIDKQYNTAVIGKWHLSDYNDFAPDYGIDYFAGIAQKGGVRSYDRWQFTENGKTEITTEYATTKITDSAKKWIESQTSPWLCWVAYNAPHDPLHLPPKNMHSNKKLSGTDEDIQENPLDYFLAMVESFDYDMGRLLESVDLSNTTIIFIGDNGTAKTYIQAPYNPRHGKGSLYDTGVVIPMIVSGAGVTDAGTRSDALVSAVDIFPTVLEFSGQTLPLYEDSFSFAQAVQGGEGLRKFNYAEILNPRMGYSNAISDGRYKLITSKTKVEQFYDTKEDVIERNNLISKELTENQSEALETLRKELKKMNIPLDSIPDNLPNAKGDPAKRNSRNYQQQGGYQRNNSKNSNGYQRTNYNNNNRTR